MGKLVIHQWTWKAQTASLPDSQSTQQLLGAVQSDLTTQTFSQFLQRLTSFTLTGLCFDFFFRFDFPHGKTGKCDFLHQSGRSLCFHACSFKVSPGLFLGTLSSLVFWPLSWTSFPDQTCFLPSPPPLLTPLHCLLHGFATFSSSSPSFFLFPLFLYSPHHFTFQLDSLHAIFSL